MSTYDIIKAQNIYIPSIGNLLYYKFPHGPTSYRLNGKNLNFMLEYCIVLGLLTNVATPDQTVYKIQFQLQYCLKARDKRGY